MVGPQINGHRIQLYRTLEGPVVDIDGRYYRIEGLVWDALFNRPDLGHFLLECVTPALVTDPPETASLLPPIDGQEVWAAGVTYERSKTARVEESLERQGADFYDRVYRASRPELFFKATRHRVVGHGQPVGIRRDSRWSVPEPELALAIDATGNLVGYTIGNDMSARDIEGENPLYLPQAKTHDRCCALGPGLWVASEPPSRETAIRLSIARNGTTVFAGETTLSNMRRSIDELLEFLFRDNSFPVGCYLLTGTGIVPPDDFALRPGDRIRITIDPIGTLENKVIQPHAVSQASAYRTDRPEMEEGES